MAVQNDNTEFSLKMKIATENYQKIGELSKEINSLKKTIAGNNKELREMEKQGKANTTEYKNLKNQTKEYEATVKKNTAEIRNTEKAMGLQLLTMQGLKNRYRDLKKELEGVSKELDPKRWNELNRS